MIEGARFLDTTDGYILTEKHDHEVAYGHLFTPDGVVYGEPPLDAPSTPIYEACQALAPWGAQGTAQNVGVQVSLAPSLRNEETVIRLDGGTGAQGLSGASVDGDALVPFVMRVPATSTGLRVDVEIDGEPVASIHLEWPPAVGGRPGRVSRV